MAPAGKSFEEQCVLWDKKMAEWNTKAQKLLQAELEKVGYNKQIAIDAYAQQRQRRYTGEPGNITEG